MKQFKADIKAQLDDAKKTLPQLRDSVQKDLNEGIVSPDTRRLAQSDVLLPMRRVLDQVMNKFFDKYYLPKLSDADVKKSKIYFPIGAKEKNGLRSDLGRGMMNNLEEEYPEVYYFLESIQPYNNDDYLWSQHLRYYTNETHKRLTPQDQIRKKVKASNNQGLVAWRSGVSYVVEGEGKIEIHLGGQKTSINPETQLPKPHPSINISVEGYLVFEDTNINVLRLCEQSVEGVEEVVNKMLGFIESSNRDC